MTYFTEERPREGMTDWLKRKEKKRHNLSEKQQVFWGIDQRERRPEYDSLQKEDHVKETDWLKNIYEKE